jgi:DNA-binding GntR family transcriptional regulator
MQTAARHAAPLRQEAVRLIRESILDGTIAPGERLVESALCTSLGVSRTVVREALRQLESEDLVSVVPNRGPIVTVLSEHDIESIYEVRARLEGLAAELFALRAPPEEVAAFLALRADLVARYLRGSLESREAVKAEFYDILLRGSCNTILGESLRAVHARIALFRRYAFIDEKRVAMSFDEMERIIDAAAQARNPAIARQAAEMHIVLAGRLAIIEYRSRLKDSVEQQHSVL